MNQATKGILSARRSRLITEPEATKLLDEQQVRGSFRVDSSYIGYDYRNQEWIDTNYVPRRTL